MNDFFLYGMFGGVLAELLGLWKLKTQVTALPPYLRSPFYWVVTILMILAGGGLVWVYNKSGLDLTPIIAVNIGASAPLIIGSLAQSKPPQIG
jgi:hypothetical protein